MPCSTTSLASPNASAEAYSKVIEKACEGNPPVFDLMILGLGDDGHTASLFPNTDSLSVTDHWVTTSTGNQMKRITLTHPVISSSRKIIFLVRGSSKKIALRRLMNFTESGLRTPACLIQSNSPILILADKAAAEPI